MFQFGLSYVVSLVVRFVLPRGLAYLQDYTESKKDEIKAYIFGVIPSDLFAKGVWDAIEALLPVVFETAKVLLGNVSNDHVREHHIATLTHTICTHHFEPGAAPCKEGEAAVLAPVEKVVP